MEDFTVIFLGICSCCRRRRYHTPSCNSGHLLSSSQEYGPLGSVQTHSEYERRMMSVFSRVLEEVECLTKKHPPVSFLVSSS